VRVWKRADEAGFHWVSVWDHFYANPLQSRENPCFEGVATLAALAAVSAYCGAYVLFIWPYSP